MLTGNPASTASSSPGGTLQAHPPPAANWVRRTRWSVVMDQAYDGPAGARCPTMTAEAYLVW